MTLGRKRLGLIAELFEQLRDLGLTEPQKATNFIAAKTINLSKWGVGETL